MGTEISELEAAWKQINEDGTRSEMERGAFYHGALVTRALVMEAIKQAKDYPEAARLVIKCLDEIGVSTDRYGASLHADSVKELANHADDEQTLNWRKEFAELSIIQDETEVHAMRARK